MRWVLGVVVAMVLAAPARADVTVDAGALRATVTEEPFALAFTDTADGDVLRQTALGYAFDLRQPVLNNAYFGYYAAAEAETARFHATRVVASEPTERGVRLRLATDDPLGHELEATVERVAGGVIRLRSRLASGPFAARASTSTASFTSAGRERFLGFGERSNAVDQTGGSVFSWAEEGPFSSGEGEAVLRPLVPDFTFPTGPTASNFPIPWLVSTRGFGVLIDRTERSTFELGEPWEAEVEAGGHALTVFAGPKPAGVVRRYSAYAGRQPRPANWFFGPWVQFRGDTAERFVKEDVPTTVAQTYTHYLPCGAQDEPRERATVKRFHDLGMKVTTYFNPHICLEYREAYDEAARRGLLVKNAAGQPYVLSNPFTADEQVSEVDFTHPEAQSFFGSLLDEALDHGYDGWMEDFGEYTPTDAVMHDGTRGLEAHNRYPVLYHCASTRHTERRGRLAVFIRSGFHGVQPCARAVWGGDPTEDWSCADGLCAALHQALNMGLSGVAYWGSDIGGFHAVVNPRTSDELNVRWLQLGAVSGIMRTQANGWSPRDNRAERSQVWSPAVQPVWRRYAKLRTQLLPYVAAASAEYQRTGMPLTRQLSLAFPDDPVAARSQRELMFGDDLLAAPVVEEGARKRSLHVPAGDWIDVWRSVRWDDRPGTIALERPRVVSGGRTVELPAPLDELPLLARAGTLLPLLDPEVDTLAALGGESTVTARERRGRLRILAWPRERSTARFGPGAKGRLVSTEGRRRWSLKLSSPRRRTFTIEASLATLRRPFTPCRVKLNRKRLKRSRWRYDAAAGVLHVTVKRRRAVLRVRPGRC